MRFGLAIDTSTAFVCHENGTTQKRVPDRKDLKLAHLRLLVATLKTGTHTEVAMREGTCRYRNVCVLLHHKIAATGPTRALQCVRRFLCQNLIWNVEPFQNID